MPFLNDTTAPPATALGGGNSGGTSIPQSISPQGNVLPPSITPTGTAAQTAPNANTNQQTIGVYTPPPIDTGGLPTYNANAGTVGAKQDYSGIIIIVLALLLIGGGVWYFYYKK